MLTTVDFCAKIRISNLRQSLRGKCRFTAWGPSDFSISKPNHAKRGTPFLSGCKHPDNVPLPVYLVKFIL